MSFVADLYQLGYAPLQHHDRAFDIDYRIVRYAVRLDGWDEDLRPEVQDGDAGDVLGALLWRAAAPEPEQTAPARPISGWWYAAPSVVHRAEGATTRRATIARDLPDTESGFDVRPIRDAKGAADLRFEPMAPNYPSWAHRLPKGWQGSVASASEEYAQIPTLLPAALGLVAANHAGDPIHSTPVLDLDDEQRPDEDRRALLHSAWRVVLPEPSDVAPLRGPSLAWQLGRGGPQRLTSGHGLCWDEAGDRGGDAADDAAEAQDETRGTTTPRNPAGAPGPSASTTPRDGGEGEGAPAQATRGVVGAASARVSGPLDVGSSSCPHRLGVTKDGEPINALHLSTRSLFVSSGGDAPLDITDDPEPFLAPLRGVPTRVLCRIDGRASHDWIGGSVPGLRRWSVEIPIYESPPREPPIPPGTPRGPGGGGDGGHGGGPGGSGGGTPGGGGGGQPGRRHAWLVPGSLWGNPQKRRVVEAPLLGTPRDWSVPSLTFRAMPYCDPNSYDTRYWDGEWTPEYLAKWRASPVVARVESFGAELCGGEWDYDSEGESPRWRDARTAAGSLAVLPGGVGLEDVPDLDTPGRTLGSTLLGVVTGASRFAAGVPIYSGTGAGGYGDGWDWGTDSSGNLVFRSLSSTGVATSRWTMDSDGDLVPATASGVSVGSAAKPVSALYGDSAYLENLFATGDGRQTIFYESEGLNQIWLASDLKLAWVDGLDTASDSPDLLIARVGAGVIGISDASGSAAQIDVSGLTANRAIVVQDAAGTLALTSDIVTDHGALGGLSDDDHTGYARLAGRGANQTLSGGDLSVGGGASDYLVLRASATSGVPLIQLSVSSGAILTNKDLVPILTATDDLGGPSNKYVDLHLSGQVNAATMALGGDTYAEGSVTAKSDTNGQNHSTVGGAATVAGGGDGGDVVLRGGLGDGAGTNGSVRVTDAANTIDVLTVDDDGATVVGLLDATDELKIPGAAPGAPATGHFHYDATSGELRYTT